MDRLPSCGQHASSLWHLPPAIKVPVDRLGGDDHGCFRRSPSRLRLLVVTTWHGAPSALAVAGALLAATAQMQRLLAGSASLVLLGAISITKASLNIFRNRSASTNARGFCKLLAGRSLGPAPTGTQAASQPDSELTFMATVLRRRISGLPGSFCRCAHTSRRDGADLSGHLG